MEECFQLKEYGKLSLFEQAQMTAEERVWWLKRLEKEAEERKKAEEGVASGVSRPSVPRVPGVSMPSISVPHISVPRGR